MRIARPAATVAPGRTRWLPSTAVAICAALFGSLLAAASLAGCKSTPFGADTGPRSSTPSSADAGRAGPSAVATPPPPVDPLGIPPPPPGSTTSDRGERLARPTPIGQIAPEEAPTVAPAARTPLPPPRSTVTPR